MGTLAQQLGIEGGLALMGVIVFLFGALVLSLIHASIYTVYTVPLLLSRLPTDRSRITTVIGWLHVLAPAVCVSGAILVVRTHFEHAAPVVSVTVATLSVGFGAGIVWATRRLAPGLAPVAGFVGAVGFLFLNQWLIAFLGWHLAAAVFTAFWAWAPKRP